MTTKRERRKITLSFLAVVAISTVVLAVMGFAVNDAHNAANAARSAARRAADNSEATKRLARENTHRISEIQASRLASCRQTYRAFHDLFAPFVNRPGQTAKERADAKQFFALIEHKKQGCIKQVRPK